MAEYIITTDSKQDVYIAKTGADVQAVLEGKIEELVNQGMQAEGTDIGTEYLKATPQEQLEVKAILKKPEEPVEPEVVIP